MVSMRRRAYRILPQYQSTEFKPWWPMVQLGMAVAGVVLAFYVGALLALGGSQAFSFVAVPVGVLLGLALWLLPDVANPKDPPFHKLFLAYLILVVAWPSYVALALPGLPWITPARLVLAVLLVLALVHFAQNATLRQHVLATLTHDKWAARAWLGYYLVGFTVAVIGLTPATSIGILSNSLILNGLCMVIAAALFRRESAIWAVALTIALGLIAVLLIAVLENWMQMPPWINSIPSFMRVDENYLEIYTSPQARIGDGRYRVRSTFPVVLYFGFYLNLAMPVLFYMMARMKGPKLLLGLALVPLIGHAVWAANARTAVLAVAFTLFGYAALLVARQLLSGRRTDSLKSGLVVASITAALLIGAALVASSHRAQVFMFGGAQHADSDAGRDQQWENTRDYLRGNLIGAGTGNSGNLVGVAQGNGVLAVDSYWISILVDNGVVGFVCYMSLWLRLIWLGINTFLRARTPLENLSAAFTVGLVNYVVTSYVIATDMVTYLCFIYGAGVLTLHRSQTLRLAREAQDHAAQSPVPVYGALVPVR
jgi:hypothetical protein